MLFDVDYSSQTILVILHKLVNAQLFIWAHLNIRDDSWWSLFIRDDPCCNRGDPWASVMIRVECLSICVAAMIILVASVGISVAAVYILQVLLS